MSGILLWAALFVAEAFGSRLLLDSESLLQSVNGTGVDDGPRQCIFKTDPHVWVQHRHTCPCRTPRFCQADSTAERLGCALPDFATAERVTSPTMKFWFDGVAGREVHWTGSNYDQVKFEYRSGPSGGWCSSDYRMPDYCSRAIISELSTVYDGVRRYPRLLPATKALFDTKSERCSTAYLWGADGVYADLLKPEPTAKACWNFGQDWRRMWCAKYKPCSCDHSDGSCENEDKIQCCRDMYQLFLDENPQWKDVFPSDWIADETVETVFSIRVLKRSHRSRVSWSSRPRLSANWQYRWLRLAVRTASTKPNIFLQYGHGPGFAGAVTFDLCKQIRISVNGNEFQIAQEGHKYPSYRFRMEAAAQVQVKVGAATNSSWTASYVLDRVAEARLGSCYDGKAILTNGEDAADATKQSQEESVGIENLITLGEVNPKNAQKLSKML